MNEFYKRNHETTDGEPLKAIIYCRVSSVAQTKKGDGLQSQETALPRVCRLQGLPGDQGRL